MAKPKRKWPRYTAMILLAAVLTISMALVLVEDFAPGQTLIPQGIVGLPSRVISAVLKPMQSAFAWVTQGVSGYFSSLKLQKTIEIEYNKLKVQNDELIYASLYNDELEQEVLRLQKLANVVADNREQNPVTARVIAKETGNWYQMFTIDKGSKDKIKVNMAVINELGLIGYIYNVHDTSSDVVSIIDSRAGVAGIIQSSRSQGTVRGTLGIADEPTCRMYYLPADEVPRPNDVVVTSGIGMPFPKGLRIGSIRESTRYPEENKQYVVIEPFVDFMHIEEVVVLVYEAPNEDFTDDNESQPGYSPQPLDTRRPVPAIGDAIDDPDLGAVTAPQRAPRSVPGEEDAASFPDTTVPPEDGDVLDPFQMSPDATPTLSPEDLAEIRRVEAEMQAEQEMEAGE